MAATFHPELSDDTLAHATFLERLFDTARQKVRAWKPPISNQCKEQPMSIMKTIHAARGMAIAAAILSQSVFAQPYHSPYTPRASMSRAGHAEAYAGFRGLFSENVSFPGGTSINTEDDLGFAIGFGQNFNQHFLWSGEFAWSTVDYDGTLVSAEVPAIESRKISGELEVASFSTSATWHFRPGPLTPYASATLGWNFIDSNIAAGPPQIGCWWDPWYGQICAPVQETLSDDSFSYGLGLGIRWDFSYAGFMRFGYQHSWIDIANANGTPQFGGVRLEFGSLF
jgi:opacity protein-like surface antigen